MKANAIILAAGRSSRMGCHKALLPGLSGLSLWKELCDFYAACCDQVVITLHPELFMVLKDFLSKAEKKKVKLICHTDTEAGMVYSVRAALMELKDDAPVFLHPVDNVCKSMDLLEALYAERFTADVVKPMQQQKGGHPILMSPNVFSAIREAKRTDVLSELLSGFSVKRLEFSGKEVLSDLDTPEEYYNWLWKEKILKYA